ncbi:rabenosyn-5 [Danio aesculapii]|uniref:rabenosyn-5 n=1 Tax=Danio aesculapii TaxID=1142201 RepID=UPI0024C02805|nr:rabenosyn-5 [Danio aesculapii]
MASIYPPSLEDSAEVKEGFLCPLCLKDLQSFYQLQDHYEEEHAGDSWHVGGQLKSLVQKAKKAKDKLLKRDGDERTDSSYESFYYGGVDPYMWEPQELGATRSHLDYFKKQRAARIDHYVIEVNKCIIRLEKLTSFDRTSMDAAQIRSLEKSVVSWVSDQDVPFCPDCGGKFNLRNRRHHCRLCGSIMCRKCTEFVPLPMAYKLTSGTREALWAPGSGGSPVSAGPAAVQQSSRRGSISSISSVTSVLEEKDEDRVRCCHHCMDALLRHQRKLEEKDHVPDIVKLYERLRTCMDKVEAKAPEYTRMAESLNAGEKTYSLESTAALRMEIQKYYELIDVLSKKILTLGLKEELQPHPKALQLQRMVRYTATLFIQEKLLGLTSLPTKEKYEELKEKRRVEQEKRAQQERQVSLEAHKRRLENEKNRPTLSVNGDVAAPRVTKAGGWLPQSDTRSEQDDPLLQQIENIESFLRQARSANRSDEVCMLEENLRQLQDEFDAQQTSRAIEISQRLADQTDLQQKQIQHLQQREMEHRALAKTQERPLRGETDKAQEHSFRGELEKTEDHSLRGETYKAEEQSFRANKTQHLSLRANTTQDPSLRGDTDKTQEHSLPPLENKPPSKNPFDEEHFSPIEEEPTNFQTANGKKEYNPFEEENDDHEDLNAAKNPFEEDDDDDDDGGNPFKESSDEIPASSTNPFDEDEDDTAIEEELLLQQIDNIRAYIFDAKLSGRSDEVELLSENLKELQRTLREQKRKK